MKDRFFCVEVFGLLWSAPWTMDTRMNMKLQVCRPIDCIQQIYSALTKWYHKVSITEVSHCH